MHSSRNPDNYDWDNDDEDDDDDDDDIPNVDIQKFIPPPSYGHGRSAPNQRKAMSTKSSSSTSVYVCTNCGSEFVKWMGRCPTCKNWNTLQEFKVNRKISTSSPRPIFDIRQSDSSSSSSSSSSRSWLGSYGGETMENQPVRITDVYQEIESNDSDTTNPLRRPSRILIPEDDELNAVLGGGIMMGSLILIGGDPGVGKSTLMLQVAGAVASLASPQPGIGMGLPLEDNHYGPVWYVSGEENSHQIASRALRLGIQQSELWLLPETHVDTLCEKIVASYHPTDTASGVLPTRPPSLLVIDSIQTMICDSGGSSAAGGVTQVRECVGVLLRLAKSTGIPIFLVGHVTKSGDVAGPRTVEHMVDCVLYLEGGDHRTVGDVNLRMLRASKNRFGSSDELGVYEMTSGRLVPVRDPSSLFLSTRLDTEDLEGCSISIVLEGLRSMTVEIQALVTSNMEGKGRRTVNGFAYNRLQLLLGVLQKRCGMFFGKYDVYLNVVGNMRLDASKNEGSASDLAVSLALVSSLLSIPVRSDTAFVGEVGLLGEIRSVPVIEKRLQEAQRMGFSRVITPRLTIRGRGKNGKKGGRASISRLHGVEWIQCDTLIDALNQGLIREVPKRQRRRKAKKVDFDLLEDSAVNDDHVILDVDDNDDDDDDENFDSFTNSFFE